MTSSSRTRTPFLHWFAAHPEWADEITAWSGRFLEMYGGVFDGTVDLLRELHRRRVPLVASTNWGAESG
jgi:2-haloacid dehalogenase